MALQYQAHKRLVLFAVLVLAVLSIIGAIVVGDAKKRQGQPRERVNAIPPAFSKVEDLTILSVKIVNAGTAAAGVVVEIWNRSDKAVMMVDLECGEGGITRNGLTDEEKPIVVIQPHGTTTMRMNFGEMTPGAPLVVSAVTYADHTEEGDQASLNRMHRLREHDRIQRKAEKERQLQEGSATP